MKDIFSRTKLLIGEENLSKLNTSKVAIFGLGGVGGYVFEALVRAGIGNFIIVDNDTIDISNLNRQILATLDNVGKKKIEVAEIRAKSINPNVKITAFDLFVLPENIEKINLNGCDYIIDAIDTMSAKVAIVKAAKEKNIKIISCMGTGNKLHASKLNVADIFSTNVCPVCKTMRNLLKKEKIDSLTVVYSEEKPSQKIQEFDGKSRTIASLSTVPAMAGILIADEVLNNLIV